MAEEEENQVTTKERTTKDPKRVTTKNPKKVDAGKRLAEYNHRKREAQKNEVSQYYSIGAVLAVGVLGGLGYYVYQAKVNNVVPPPSSNHTFKLISLKWSNQILFSRIIKWTRRV